MAPMRANQAKVIGCRAFISGRLKTNAKPNTRTAPVRTVKNVAAGADTCWVPNLTRMLPLAKPNAAMNANTIAKLESLMTVQCSLEG